MRFEIIDRADNQFGARIVASNGKILFSSEGYVRKRSAIRACKVVRAAHGRKYAPVIHDMTSSTKGKGL